MAHSWILACEDQNRVAPPPPAVFGLDQCLRDGHARIRIGKKTLALSSLNTGKYATVH